MGEAKVEAAARALLLIGYDRQSVKRVLKSSVGDYARRYARAALSVGDDIEAAADAILAEAGKSNSPIIQDHLSQAGIREWAKLYAKTCISAAV